MTVITDIIEYADVKVGYLKICIGEKTKKYRALWLSHLADTVNGEDSLPTGSYPLKYKNYQSVENCPSICFNKVFSAPIYPLGRLSFEQMMPFVYIQHKDGTEVSREEWRQVADIMSMYCNSIQLDKAAVKVSSKEFMNKATKFDLENW